MKKIINQNTGEVIDIDISDIVNAVEKEISVKDLTDKYQELIIASDNLQQAIEHSAEQMERDRLYEVIEKSETYKIQTKVNENLSIVKNKLFEILEPADKVETNGWKFTKSKEAERTVANVKEIKNFITDFKNGDYHITDSEGHQTNVDPEKFLTIKTSASRLIISTPKLKTKDQN